MNDYENNEINKAIDSISLDELINVTQHLIQIPSVNPPGLECKVGRYVKNYLEHKGIKTEIQKVMPGRFNVIAKLRGKGEARPILFSSHMDVVPVSSYEAKRWRFDPFAGQINDGYIYGRGAADAKGGLAAAMVALCTLHESNIKPKGDVILAATVDEENLMTGAKKLIENPILADVERAVCCEPTNLELKICSKGRMWAEVTVYGQTAHASVKSAGSNAIYRALRLMNEMETHSFSHKKHPSLGETFWQTTMIHGGGASGIIPDNCTLNVDVRLVPGQTHNDIWKEMKVIFDTIKKDIPDFHADINEIERREPWEISSDDKLVRTMVKSCSMVDVPIIYSGYIATAECTIYKRMGIEGMIFGPGKLQDNAYKENERVAIEELLKAAQVYLATMLNWE
ncbi:M20 family metallopeptidase [Desulfitibacter alkalitolerans]|uniref:M20 family metallopeptidase n=1 Tax=Desulfitibacter alkalitolerans TaxID=264641 RepID=UPI0004843A9C|nr:M20 family metallopeptidase [Desulfitibacter alkalitolerans]